MTLVVMDLEIETPVTDWDAARRGENGISVMCISDYDTGIYAFYGGDTLEAGATQLEDANCIVTFNGRGFDIPCLEGVIGRTLKLQGHYDILREIWDAMPEQEGNHKGTGLGPTCERTLGIGKSGNGERAPKLYAEGRFPELYTYCWHDVYLTSMLFTHIIENGFVIGPDGDKICVKTLEDTVNG